MPNQNLNIDFLNVREEEFESLDEVTSYVSDSADLGNLDGDLSIISTVTDFEDLDALLESIGSQFDIIQRNGQLVLLNARQLDVPYYLYWDSDFPIWFTTGRKTEDLPKTIDTYLQSQPHIGRLWISKPEMDGLRQSLVQNYPGVLMTYFTATRSEHSEVDAQRRPGFKRTFQYYGKDALETFNEVKYEYGVLPTNLKFQKSNEFKFRVTTKGIFTIKRGGLDEVLSVIQNSIERLQGVKEAIDTSNFSKIDNKFVENDTISRSRPWAVQLQSQPSPQDVDRFRNGELEDWDFVLSEIRESFDASTPHFMARLRDRRTLGETVLRSRGNTIRIYPREDTGIGQSVRLYEFISDQIDPESYATVVDGSHRTGPA
jgi:hypothetical protein